jgi:Protein of unknown function (DUF3435)
MPLQLSAEDVEKLRLNEALAGLKAEQEDLHRQILQEFGLMKNAVGSDLYRHYERVRSRAQYKMRALWAYALNTKQDELRRFYAVDDIQQQLKGLPSTAPTVTPPPIYSHPERARLAEKLFSSDLCKVGIDADLENRVAVLTDLVALCKLKELPRSRALAAKDPNRQTQLGTDIASVYDDSDVDLCFLPPAATLKNEGSRWAL